jgi:hypothetical protein
VKQEKFECAAPPAGDVDWYCHLKALGFARKPLIVKARTAFAAGQIAGQHFDCHWSDLDVRLADR